MVDDGNEQVEWKDINQVGIQLNDHIRCIPLGDGEQPMDGTRRTGGPWSDEERQQHKLPRALGCTLALLTFDWSVNPFAPGQLDSYSLHQQSRWDSVEGVNPLNEEAVYVVSGA